MPCSLGTPSGTAIASAKIVESAEGIPTFTPNPLHAQAATGFAKVAVQLSLMALNRRAAFMAS